MRLPKPLPSAFFEQFRFRAWEVEFRAPSRNLYGGDDGFRATD